MRMTRRCFGVLVVLAGVIGEPALATDFKSPANADLALGRTTEADLLRLYGRSDRVVRVVQAMGDAAVGEILPSAFDTAKVDGSFSLIIYEHAAGDALDHPFNTKVATFLFFNGRLIDYAYRSSFKSDATAFDISRLEAVEKGSTTEAQVLALMGPPAGVGVYPAISWPGSRVLHYGAPATTDPAVRSIASTPVNLADLLIDTRGVVVDVQARTLPRSPERFDPVDRGSELPW